MFICNLAGTARRGRGLAVGGAEGELHRTPVDAASVLVDVADRRLGCLPVLGERHRSCLDVQEAEHHRRAFRDVRRAEHAPRARGPSRRRMYAWTTSITGNGQRCCRHRSCQSHSSFHDLLLLLGRFFQM